MQVNEFSLTGATESVSWVCDEQLQYYLPLRDSVHDHYQCVHGMYTSGFVSWCNVTDLSWTGLPLSGLEMWELTAI